MAQIYLSNEWQQATPSLIAPIIRNGRAERRLAVKERRRTAAMQRAAKLALIRADVDEKQHIKDARRVLRELGLDKPDDPWGPYICMRSPALERKRAKKKRKIIRPSKQLRRLPSYRKPLIDARGRETLYLGIDYLGLKSKGWRSGLAADHTEYCSRWDALEDPETQYLKPISNIAHTMDEAIEFWKAVEPIEKEYRTNAKVQVRFVGSLPAELNAAQRREAVRQFCHDNFGRYGLGYVAFVHLPDPDGDQRNFHFHVLVTQRQCIRIGEFQWAISTEKLTQIFTPEGLYRVRCIFAAALNRQCRKAGSPRRFTHQDYDKRNMDALRTEKLGAVRTKAFRKGENVVMVDRNRDRIKANEAGCKAQKLRRALDLAEAVSRHSQRLKEVTARGACATKIRAQVAAVAQHASQALRHHALLDPTGVAVDRPSEAVAPATSSRAKAVTPRAPAKLRLTLIDVVSRVAVLSLKTAVPGECHERSKVTQGTRNHQLKAHNVASDLAAMPSGGSQNGSRSLTQKTLAQVATSTRGALNPMITPRPLTTGVRNAINDILILVKRTIADVGRPALLRPESSLVLLLCRIVHLNVEAKSPAVPETNAVSDLAGISSVSLSVPEPANTRHFPTEEQAATTMMRVVGALSKGASSDDLDSKGAAEPAKHPVADSPGTKLQVEHVASSGQKHADDQTNEKRTLARESFLGSFKGRAIFVEPSANGTVLPHAWYLKAHNLSPDDFVDRQIQAELVDRLMRQEKFRKTIVPLMAEHLNHRHLNAPLHTIAPKMPSEYRLVLTAWNGTPIAPLLWAQTEQLGQNSTMEAVENWRGSSKEQDARYGLALAAAEHMHRWPIQLDRVDREALAKDAAEGTARANRLKAAADSSSGNAAVNGLARAQATPEQTNAPRPTPHSQPQKAPENRDLIDDFLDEEFEHYAATALRTPGFADANRVGARTNAAAIMVDQYGLSPQAAEFILSLVPRLCRKADLKALKEGDDAVIDKVEDEKRDRLRKALADEKMRKLWRLLLAGLEEAGKRHAKRLREKWLAADHGNDKKRDHRAWLAWQAHQHWPDTTTSPPPRRMLEQAKAHDENLKKLGTARQQNAYGPGR